MIVDGLHISEENSVYLIAEMSANHNGNIKNAYKAIEAAKESGANAIKIQTYTADTLTIKSQRPEFYLSGGIWDGRHLYDLYKEAHTPYDWHASLFEYAKKCGITIFSTPFDDSAVELLESLDTPAYKIASFEIIDTPLIKRVALTKKPLFMSTGAASFQEISEAIQVARENGAEEILLFHCISSYPAPVEEAQLNNIIHLKEKFGVLVGLSDHTIGTDAGFLSVGMGAVAIEKHFIADRSIGGPDSEFSATPDEFLKLRKKVDLAKKMLGANSFTRSLSENQSGGIRRSIYSVSEKKKGEVVGREDLKIIRPGLGLHPRYFENLIGLKLAKDMSFGEPLNASFFDEKIIPKIKKCNKVVLEEVIPSDKQILILYDLLKTRKFSISHDLMPTMDQHENFVKNHPYRGWYLIHDASNNSNIVGSVYVSFDNSVGLNMDMGKIAFSAEYFTQILKKQIRPLAPKPSKTFGDFFYNVSPKNNDMVRWLSSCEYFVSQISFSCK
ncbi:pseudaminic acid synthase [Paracoccaceae bacterium]|nr:pseudaminic acid synthase [Paracoccaceae bacterium]